METEAAGAKTQGQIDGANSNRALEQTDPTLLQEINQKIEMHAQAIARLSKLKETKPDGLLRMRVRELRALAYIDQPF